ncbi:oxygen-insensitive NADPH nitroreductase [Paenibacillus senegalensis]|uniref:oxygen-insensitive NADPH nitroreductase n=1 Tax=Paenibacillus senegalensis TaxID=1465766 RepID=UPI0002880435|nr:oxygen-insensitive NADPH nitroreductase [Paenibacillus senegalensis]
MNTVIETILNHRSIRAFEDRALTDEQVQWIVKSAQAASTSSFVQAYSIIGIKSPEKKAKLAELAGNQEAVRRNGHFFVFCLDSYRHEISVELEGGDPNDYQASFESTEWFMVGVIDAALAAQNAAIAAESMGLGICYIGGLRNQLHEVAELLDTPNRVIPLFGLAAGYPSAPSATKPRLPSDHIYHEDAYPQDLERYKRQLQQYNEEISAYYLERTQGKRADRWTAQMQARMARPSRLYMKSFLESKGLPLK